MIHQPVINIAEIFSRKNVTNVVISPGSRSAPLTIAFARHPRIDVKVIPDERSAAFIGLGMSMTTGDPVGLVCTSGSAGLNYYPAIAEAYFQKIPLIILTADRPKEWIGQQDGQTIFQSDLYSKHIKKSYEVPADFSHKDSVWYTERIISEAINVAMEEPKGPVHINIPLREPLYPSDSEPYKFSDNIKVISVVNSTSQLPQVEIDYLAEAFLNSKKTLIIVGQGWWSSDELKVFKKFSNKTNTVIVGDILSNLHSLDSVVNSADSFLGGMNEAGLAALKPDLLITLGGSVISKGLKLFLRKYNPPLHWHIQEAGIYPDTFQSVTKIIRIDTVSFLSSLLDTVETNGYDFNGNKSYFHSWVDKNNTANKTVKEFFQKNPFSEFEAVKNVMAALPQESLLHLSNSMPVRYANYIGLREKKEITVYANRGTSGIDGCSSTAVGSAFSSNKLVVLLTGDMAFFYDRNAFWHNYNLSNLRIVILNNHGGGIFGLIDGPGSLAEREEYFETTQKLTAENTARDFNLDYFYCNDQSSLETVLKEYFEPSERGRILEIETDKSINREIFNKFKDFFKQ